MRQGARKFDFVGFSLLTTGVAALQIALDKGQEDDWFGSTFIITLVVTAAIGLTALILWEWFQKAPIVDVRLFKNFNFAATNVMFFVVGMILFSSTVLMPQFLQTLMGYTAQIAGLVLSAGALVLLATMPVVGQLASRVQARHLLAFGWAGLLVGMYVSSRWVDLYVSFGSATWVRILQYFPLGFVFVPLNAGRLCGLAGGQNEQRGRFDELHAQHWAKRGDLGGDHPDRQAFAISPIGAGGAQRIGRVGCRDSVSDHATGARRNDLA